MTSVLAAVILGALVLAQWAATISFGAVTPDFAAWAFAAGFVLVLAWGVYLACAQPLEWRKSALHLLVVAFMAYTLIRYLTAPVEYEPRFELFQVFLYGMVCLAASQTLHRPRDRAIFLGALVVLAVAESCYGFWQFARRQDLVLHLSRPVQYHGRASGTYVCPNHLAGFLEMVLGLLMARIALYRNPRKPVQSFVLEKVLQVAALLFILVGLLTSFSRGGWLAALAGLVLFLGWGGWRGLSPWPRVALVGLALGAFVLIGLKWLPDRLSIARSVVQDEQTGETQVDVTLGERTPLWAATLRIIRDYPLFGTGPGTWRWFHGRYREPAVQENPDYAHSDLLQLVSDYGVVGLALVLGALLVFYRHALRVAQYSPSADQRSFAVGSALAVSMILLHGLVDFNLHITANALLFAALLGLTAAMNDPLQPSKTWTVHWVARATLTLMTLSLAALGLWLIPRTAWAYYLTSRGKGSEKVLHWDKALDRYERARTIDPKYPEPYGRAAVVNLIRARFKRPVNSPQRLQMIQQAAQLCQQALNLNPYQTLYRLRLAEAYELLGQPEKALETYHQARDLDPKAAIVYVRWGMFHMKRGEEDRAEELFKEAEKYHGDQLARSFLFDRQQRPR